VEPSEILLHELLYFYAEPKQTRLRLLKSWLEKPLKNRFVSCQTLICHLFGVAKAGKTRAKHLLPRWTPTNSYPVQAIQQPIAKPRPDETIC